MAKICGLFAILVTFSAYDAQICKVELRKDLPDREPVYLNVTNGQANLWAPNGSALEWNSNPWDTVLLCSGNNNVLSPTQWASSRITCRSGNTFSVQGITVTSQQLQCSKTILGSVYNPDQTCGRRGTLLYLGFDSQTYGFITYIQSCMDMKRASVLWTRHILPGLAIRGAMKSVKNTPEFRSDGMPPKIEDPNQSYKVSSQLLRLTQLLGSEQQASAYVSEDMKLQRYMARGHMTPNADGIYRSWQTTTYHFINAVPLWQAINNGNWARVETVTRNVAALLKEDVVVIQGTHGISTLPHVDGRQISITLEDNGIEVPCWVWKIIKSPNRNEGIAFVTYNNPYEAPQGLICPDICKSNGWYKPEYSDFSKGFTYCCDPNELINYVQTASPEGRVAQVLTFPAPA